MTIKYLLIGFLISLSVTSLLAEPKRSPPVRPKMDPRRLVETDPAIAKEMYEKAKRFFEANSALVDNAKDRADLEAHNRVMTDPTATPEEKEKARKELAKLVWDSKARHGALRDFVEGLDQTAAEHTDAKAAHDAVVDMFRTDAEATKELGAKHGIDPKKAELLSPAEKNAILNNNVSNPAEMTATFAKIRQAAKERNSPAESHMIGILEAATLMSGGQLGQAGALLKQITKADGKSGVDSHALYGNVSVTVRHLNEYAERLQYVLGSADPKLAERYKNDPDLKEARKSLAAKADPAAVKALAELQVVITEKLAELSQVQKQIDQLQAKAKPLSKADADALEAAKKKQDDVTGALSDAFIRREAKVNQIHNELSKDKELAKQIEAGEFLSHELTDDDIRRVYGPELKALTKGDAKLEAEKIKELRDFLNRCSCGKARKRGCPVKQSVSHGQRGGRPLDWRHGDEHI